MQRSNATYWITRPGGFPGIAETSEVKEKPENFTKVTKYLTKLREKLVSFTWEISRQKAARKNSSLIPGFQICSMGKSFCILLR